MTQYKILTIEQISNMSMDDIIDLYRKGYRLEGTDNIDAIPSPGPSSLHNGPSPCGCGSKTMVQDQSQTEMTLYQSQTEISSHSSPMKMEVLGTTSCPNTVQYSSRTATANLTTTGIGPYTYAFYVNEDKKHENPSPITDTSYTFPAYAFNQSVGSHNLRWRVTDYGCSPTKVDDVTCTINITACSYSLSSTSQSFGSSGGTGSFNVTTTTGCPWTATSNNTSWITITSESSGTGDGTVNYSVSSNTGTSSRTGTITAAGQTFTITQDGIACSYSISPSSASAPNAGGTGSFDVTSPAGCTWTAVSNDTWITVTSYTGSGDGTVNYSVSSNSCGAARSGTITAAGQTFTINQAAYTPALSSITVEPAYDSSSPLSLTVGDTQPYIATAKDQCGNPMSSISITWSVGTGITTSPTSGTTDASGQTTTTVTADSVIAATWLQASSGSIYSSGTYISVSDAPPVLTTIELTPLYTSASPLSMIVGDTQDFTATAKDQYDNPMSGITITWNVGTGISASPSSGTTDASGQTTTTVTADSVIATTYIQAITATVVSDGSYITVSCSYSISPSSASALNAGGTGSFDVTSPAGCTWTAVSNDTWITITSESSGTGDGTVNYSVSSNSCGAARTGTITAAGQTFTVNQAAYTPVLTTITVSPSSKSIAVDGTVQLSTSCADQCGTAYTCPDMTWSSSNSDVASVSSTGLVTGVTTGSATIYATSGSTQGSSAITVTEAPPVLTTISVTPVGPLTMNVDDEQIFTATAKDQDSNPMSGITITWGDGGHVTVSPGSGTTNASGQTTTTLTADSLGTTTINTTSGTIVSNSVSITIAEDTPVLTTITLSPTSVSLYPTDTSTITATCKDQFNNTMTCPTLTWASTDTAVATVSNSGVVTAIAVGTASITASAGTPTIVSSITLVTVSTAPPTTGSVTITSNPSGAAIYIDDIEQVGYVTPATIPNLVSGAHTFKLTLAGYEDLLGSFDIIVGQTTLKDVGDLIIKVVRAGLSNVGKIIMVGFGIGFLYSAMKQKKKE